MRLAPPATPRMRPEVRPRKLTRRSASPSGKVFRMMASVSRAGMRCRRADILRKVTAALRGNRAPVQNLITYHTQGGMAMIAWGALWRKRDAIWNRRGARGGRCAPRRENLKIILWERRWTDG